MLPTKLINTHTTPTTTHNQIKQQHCKTKIEAQKQKSQTSDLRKPPSKILHPALHSHSPFIGGKLRALWFVQNANIKLYKDLVSLPIGILFFNGYGLSVLGNTYSVPRPMNNFSLREEIISCISIQTLDTSRLNSSLWLIRSRASFWVSVRWLNGFKPMIVFTWEVQFILGSRHTLLSYG